MGPIKTSQFAEIWLAGESLADNPVFEPSASELTPDEPGKTKPITFVKAGIVTSLRIQENLNSTQRNVIGTPVPVFMPGYYQATISAQKATLDLKSWKTVLNINPFTAFRPGTYVGGEVQSIEVGTALQQLTSSTESSAIPGRIPRFNFILYLKDKIASEDTLGDANTTVGIFVCMLQNYSVNITSDNSIILEDITMLARPLAGSWFGAIQDIFETNPAFGYEKLMSGQKPAATGG